MCVNLSLSDVALSDSASNQTRVGYQSLRVGVNLAEPLEQKRWADGMRPAPAHGTVLNYNPNATVLSNCTIAIEGCAWPGPHTVPARSLYCSL